MFVEKPDSDRSLITIQFTQSARADPTFTSIDNKEIIETLLSDENRKKEMDNVNFTNERFELVVDARGYRPEDLKCIVNATSVEISGQRQENANGSQRSLSTSRNYELPNSILPQQTVCCMSSEGVLVILAPWQK